MIVDGINLIDGVIVNAIVESGTTLPTTHLINGRLFHLTEVQGQLIPGLYIHNGVDWERSGQNGDIEAVNAGTGLLGGGTTGAVTLYVDTNYVATKNVTDNLQITKLSKTGGTMTGDLDMNSNKISNVTNPLDNSDVATKEYVDTAATNVDLSGRVAKSGDTMTGDLVINSQLFAVNHITGAIRAGTSSGPNVSIKPSAIEASSELRIRAGAANSLVHTTTESGITLSSGKYLVLGGTPTANLHAATKQYVDALLGSVGGDLGTTKVSKSGDTMTGDLILPNDTSQPLGAITRQYVDIGLGGKLDKSGDTMTGALTLSGTPTANLHAATKQYVDNSIAGVDLTQYFEVNGGTITGSVNIAENLNVAGDTTFSVDGFTLGDSFKVLADPDYFGAGSSASKIQLSDSNGTGAMVDGGFIIEATTTTDGTTEELLRVRNNEFMWKGGQIWHAGNDGHLSGLDADTVDGIHANQFARRDIATTITDYLTLHADPVDDMHAATKRYVDGLAAGIDAKQSVRVATSSSISLSGLITIDDVTIVDGDRVLVKNQTTPSDNGIYVTAVGAWSRSEDADGTPAHEVSSGLFCFVEEGTSYANSGWVLTTPNPITVGTTDLYFARFSGAGQLTAGNGLLKTGDTISVGAGTGIVTNSSDVALDLTYTDTRYLGLSANAVSSSRWSTARTITLNGDVSGSVAMDGASNVNINTTVNRVGEYYTNQNITRTSANLDTIFVNTSGNEVLIHLPSSPTLGDEVTIIDQKGSFGTNKCVVGRNGENIMGLTENMDITTSFASVTLVYSGNAVDGWRIKQ